MHGLPSALPPQTRFKKGREKNSKTKQKNTDLGNLFLCSQASWIIIFFYYTHKYSEQVPLPRSPSPSKPIFMDTGNPTLKTAARETTKK